MNISRVVIGKNSGFKQYLTIPPPCERDKTITYSAQAQKFTLFKDTRPYAVQWVNIMLPQFAPNLSAETVRKAFWGMPAGGYMEFDVQTKELSFCYIELISKKIVSE